VLLLESFCLQKPFNPIQHSFLPSRTIIFDYRIERKFGNVNGDFSLNSGNLEITPAAGIFKNVVLIF
jgi:hypothetical protein